MIGKVITQLLITDATLTALVKANHIFPYVINEDTQLPAIIYTIDSLDADYTKDGLVGDDITFTITTYSTDYFKLQDIVEAIRGAIELKQGTAFDISYDRMVLTGFSEGYNINENAFLNRLTFNTFTTK